MNQISGVPDRIVEASLVETGTRLVSNTARWGLRSLALPFLPLPQVLRESAFDAARLAIQSVNLLPRSFLEIMTGLAEELDDLESRSSRREDLARRMRRETRMHGRAGEI